MKVGTIEEIWRFPFKSMAGERLDRAQLGPKGIVGDRGWAVRDEERGGIRGAKKIPGLMQCAARYVSEPRLNEVPPVEIELPDGSVIRSDADDASGRLSAALGRPVSLWPLQPATNLAHYRRGAPDHERPTDELRAVFGLASDEPLPDLSIFPSELTEYESPPGTYFDAFPLLLLTTASLAELQRRAPDSRIDVRRFRPNLVIAPENGASGWVEANWAGRRMQIGDIPLDAHMLCPRCVMTTLPQDDLPKDPKIMRTLVKEANQNLGLYATPGGEGTIEVGDPVYLVAN